MILLMIKKFILATCLFCGLVTASSIYAQQPASPLQSSFETYRKMKEETKYKLNWVSLGPTVNSARADVVQVDPTNPGTMYVGFGSGGIWKTINNGINWHVIFENQASLGIGDMELAPSNSSIIYVGTGENLKNPGILHCPEQACIVQKMREKHGNILVWKIPGRLLK